MRERWLDRETVSSQVLSNVVDGDNWPARQGKTGVALRVARRRNEPQPSGGAARQECLAWWGAWRSTRRAAMRQTLIAPTTMLQTVTAAWGTITPTHESGAMKPGGTKGRTVAVRV